MIAGDFNGDGHLDLLVRDSGLFLSTFLGDGKGHLAQMQPFDFHALDGILAADFNGDGKLDLYVPEYGQNGVVFTYILLGNGDGTFNIPSTAFAAHFEGAPAIGDFNRDGKLDLAMQSQSVAGQIGVFLGNGDGTFSQNPLVFMTSGGSGTSVNTADVNGDGNLDLITDNGCVLLGAGDGTFKQAGCSTGGPSYKVNIGDFNGDGKMDFAISTLTNSGNPIVMLSLGNGDGTFQSPVVFGAPGAGSSFRGFDIGDFKRDGKLGLVISAQSTLLFFQDSVLLSPTSLAFGSQDVGTTSPPQIATLTNLRSSGLPIQIGIKGTDPQDFAESDNCGNSLPAGKSCQINVAFTPQASGNRAASLYVKYPGFGSPQTVSLSGYGLTVSASLTPASLTFPLRLVNTTSPPQIATLTNTGQDVLLISSISTTGPFRQTNNCPASLSVNSNCQIQVQFTPTGRGQANGMLSVNDNAPGSPQMVALSGSGTVVWLSVTGINFGDWKVGNKSAPAPIRLTNKGKRKLTISQIAFTGTDPGDFSQTNNCGAGLAAGHSCTIKVTFTPMEQGQRSAQLNITDDGGGSPQTVQLAGTGT